MMLNDRESIVVRCIAQMSFPYEWTAENGLGLRRKGNAPSLRSAMRQAKHAIKQLHGVQTS